MNFSYKRTLDRLARRGTTFDVIQTKFKNESTYKLKAQLNTMGFIIARIVLILL